MEVIAREVISGLFVGLLSGFFLIYSLQFNRPYPEFILDVLYYPYIIAVLILCAGFLFMVDDKLGVLLLLIIIIFIVDMYLRRDQNKIS